MKLSIVPCYSYFYEAIIEHIKYTNDHIGVDPFLAQELKKREVCLSGQLIKNIKSEFKKKYPQLTEKLDQYLNPLIIYEGRYKEISLTDNHDSITTESDSYKKILFHTTYNTKDKIALSNLFDKNKIEDLSIEIIKTKEIKGHKNTLNDYRLPIIKNISSGEKSYELGQWLKRFFLKSNEITIVDPYFYNNMKSSYKYLFKYINLNTKLKIYMLHPKENNSYINEILMKEQIKADFGNNFNIEINSFEYGEQHDRFLVNEEYYFYFGKGLGVFKGSRTDQSEVRITKKEDAHIKIPTIINTWNI